MNSNKISLNTLKINLKEYEETIIFWDIMPSLKNHIVASALRNKAGLVLQGFRKVCVEFEIILKRIGDEISRSFEEEPKEELKEPILRAVNLGFLINEGPCWNKSTWYRIIKDRNIAVHSDNLKNPKLLCLISRLISYLPFLKKNYDVLSFKINNYD